MKIVFKMLFLTFSNASIFFIKKNSFKRVIYLRKLCSPTKRLNLLIKKIYNFSTWPHQKVFYNTYSHFKRDNKNVNSLFASGSLLEHNGINNYTIKLVESKQFSYNLIYSLGQVKLKTLKIYIKTHLKIKLIWLFKSFVRAPIFFN